MFQSLFDYSLHLVHSVKKTLYDIFHNFDLTKEIISFFHTVTNKISDIFEAIKNEVINIFNGTTFTKIFNYSCDFFSNVFDTIKNIPYFSSSEAVDDPMRDLMKRINELKETIKSSKNFIHTIIEKIRDKGKVKIVNKLNHNPHHPEYQSTFPDLHVASQKSNSSDESYPLDFNEKFDANMQEGILSVNNHFSNKIQNNAVKSYYNHITDNNTWTTPKNLHISENIKNIIQNLQVSCKKLQESQELNPDFMEDFNSCLFIVDGNLIYSTNKQDMLREFKRIVPNITDQKLIATYARPKILNPSYSQLISENPELGEYQTINSRNIYEVTHFSDGSLRLIVTNLSNIRPVHNDENSSAQKYSSFGVRTSVTFAPSSYSPVIEYAHFIN